MSKKQKTVITCTMCGGEGCFGKILCTYCNGLGWRKNTYGRTQIRNTAAARINDILPQRTVRPSRKVLTRNGGAYKSVGELPGSSPA